MITIDRAVARAKSWGGALLGIAMLLGFFAGWILAAGAAYELYMIDEAKSWPAKRAVVTASYANRPRGFGLRRFNNVEIAGSYTATNERFGLRRVGYGIEHAVVTRSRAEAFAKRYPVGTELDVFHEPESPREVILVRGNSPTPTWIALAAGLLLGVLPLASAALSASKK
jgi:hypothetical protein